MAAGGQVSTFLTLRVLGCGKLARPPRRRIQVNGAERPQGLDVRLDFSEPLEVRRPRRVLDEAPRPVRLDLCFVHVVAGGEVERPLEYRDVLSPEVVVIRDPAGVAEHPGRIM